VLVQLESLRYDVFAQLAVDAAAILQLQLFQMFGDIGREGLHLSSADYTAHGMN